MPEVECRLVAHRRAGIVHDSCEFLILFRAHCGAEFCVRAFSDLRLTCATMFIGSRINNCQSFVAQRVWALGLTFPLLRPCLSTHR